MKKELWKFLEPRHSFICPPRKGKCCLWQESQQFANQPTNLLLSTYFNKHSEDGLLQVAAQIAFNPHGCFVNTPQQVSHLHLVSSASSQAGQLRKVDCSRTRLDLSKSSFKFDATPSGILRSIKPTTRSPSRPAFKFKSPPKHDLSLCRSELSCFQQSQFYADFITTITTVLMNSCSPRLTACPTAAGYEES